MNTESTLSILHKYHDAWERGDQEAGMSYYADDVVVHMGGNGPLAGTYVGREAFSRDWIGRVADYTDVWKVEGNDLLVAGEDSVLLIVYETWTRGDLEVRTRRLGSYRFENGQIVECWFSDMNQAEVEAFFGDLT